MKIRLRRGTATEWVSKNPILALGEPGLETDTRKLKFGDGVSNWATLAYSASSGGGGGAAWGDITGALASQSDLNSALSGKAAALHSHAIVDVTGLQSALDGKQPSGSYAPTSHTHVISDITGLQSEIDAKQPTLVSATNIKTVNGNSLLGSGDVTIAGGGASIKSASITIPSDKGGRLGARQTVVDAEVTALSKIVVMLGSTVDSDENEAEFLDVTALSATPQAGSFIVSANFGARVAGIIKINYMIGA